MSFGPGQMNTHSVHGQQASSAELSLENVPCRHSSHTVSDMWLPESQKWLQKKAPTHTNLYKTAGLMWKCTFSLNSEPHPTGGVSHTSDALLAGTVEAVFTRADMLHGCFHVDRLLKVLVWKRTGSVGELHSNTWGERSRGLTGVTVGLEFACVVLGVFVLVFILPAGLAARFTTGL